MEYNNFDEELNALHDRVLAKALTEEEQNNYTESLFESIKHINEYGQEFLRAFAKENIDTPIYIKPVFSSSLGEFYNAENEIIIEDYDE